MKKCVRCLESKEEEEFHRNWKAKDGLQSWCRTCAAAYRAAYCNTEKGRRNKRNGTSRWQKRNKEKRRAHRRIERAVRFERITKPPGLVAHHWDYSQPLNVRWLENETHIELHAWCRRFREYYESLGGK